MKVRFYVDLLGSTKSQRGFAWKEADLPFAPAIGSEVESSAWKSPRKVTSTVLNVDNGTLVVLLGTHEVTDMGLDAYSYEGHGWTLSDDLQKASAVYAATHNMPSN